MGCSEMRTLPPPEPPPHVLPTLRITPVLPSNGETVVGISTDTPANVDEIVAYDEKSYSDEKKTSSSETNSTGHSETFDFEYSTFSVTSTERRHPVCLSPCVTTFAPGVHVLRVFSLAPDGPSSVVSLKVDRSPLAFRYTVASGKPSSFPGRLAGQMLWGIGIAATVLGGLILGVGLAGAPDAEHRLTSGLVGGITAGAGLILIGTGIAVENAFRGVLIPGRGATWTQDPPYIAP
ncbi:MAG TPA: hypothetical protein VF316_21895 [Polyangiaceae bacterium]